MPLRSPIRIGILGGSFDPVHIGHLIVAEHVAEQLKLDRVLLIPCCVPPHKPSAAQAPGRDRLAMVRLAIRGNRRFMTSDCELRRGGVSYSVDTLEALRGAYGPTATLV
ncbi:MAG: nicotinate-nicotinamide nucleotide adenylyltransferase [Candidatus Aureabacteria bacterium]|nr:nicotinate-nicotinamide nucleotide adenylyltransferase [Candidatus Auribacterota bacterium]